MIGQGGNLLDKTANLAGQSVRSGIIGGAQGAGLSEDKVVLRQTCRIGSWELAQGLRLAL